MAKKKNKKGGFKQKLIDKYRFVVLSENTFEEKISFKLNRLNVFVLGTLIAIFLIVGTTFIIAYTPLREYIPGYSSSALKKEATSLVYEVDSLKQVLKVNNLYYNNIKQLLSGKIDTPTFDRDSVLEVIKNENNPISFEISKEDSLLREEVALNDRYSLFQQAKKKLDIVFFAPITGTITQEFKVKDKHFAVDIAVSDGDAVKSVADGTVIFAEWTAATGHVMIIKHAKGFTSVYKHNTALQKNQGDFVRGGEVIALAGSTGELTTGTHLHFELWNEGLPVNPLNFIDFE